MLMAYGWHLENQDGWTYWQRRNGDAGVEAGLEARAWGRRGKDRLRKEHWHPYTIVCETDNRQDAAAQHREARLALRDDLEGWGGEGRRSRGRGYMCRIMTHSRCLTAETTTALHSNYPPKKKKSNSQGSAGADYVCLSPHCPVLSSQ